MEGKKKYFALVLFLFLGLMIFTFANPVEEEKEFKDGNKEQSEKVTDKKEDTTKKDKDTNGQEQQNVQHNVTNTNANTNNANTQNRQDDSIAKALAAVELAEGTYKQEDLDSAKELVNNVTDTTEKGKLQERLDEVEAGIAVLALLENLETQVDEAAAKVDMTNATTYRDDNEISDKIAALNNENVKETLQERLAEVSKLLDDNAAPSVNVEAKAYKENVTITAEDTNSFTLFLARNTGKEEKIENNTETVEEGIYTLRMIDDAFNEQTIRFIVDGTDPVLKDLSNGGHYSEVTINVEDLSEVTIKVTNMDKNETTEVENGTKLTDEATYKIEVEDEAGNKTTYYVAIDKTKPAISTTDKSIINYTKWTEVTDKFLTIVRITREAPDGTITTEEFTRANFEVGERNENFKFRYKLKEEGKYTIYGEDKFGNFKEETVTVDKTAAKQHAVNINVTGYKNNIEDQYATNGNKVSAYISINEELKRNPTFTFFANGKEIKVMKDEVVKSNSTNVDYPYVYTATLEITEDLVAEDGLVTFTVTNIYDKAGNKTADITKTTTNKEITLDRTAPKANYVAILSNKTNDYRYAKNGDIVRFLVGMSEEIVLNDNFTVTLGNLKPVKFVRSQGAGYEYIVDYKIPEEEQTLTEGELTFLIQGYADKAGNKGNNLTTATHKTYNKVIYDRTKPEGEVTSSNNNGLAPTNKDVVATLKTKEYVQTPEGWTVEVEGYEFTRVYTTNVKTSVKLIDKAGNENTIKFEIKRIDKVAPELTITEPEKYQLEVYSEYTDKGYSAYDKVDKDVTKLVKKAYEFQSKGEEEYKTVEGIDTSKLGTYKVTYTAYDKAGNTTIGTREVEVVDTTAPLITVNGEKTFTIEAGLETYEELGATVTDNYDETITNLQPSYIHYRDKDNKLEKVTTVDNKKVGQYKIVYEYTDSNGNVGVDSANHKWAMRVVYVEDTTAPVVTTKQEKDLTLEAGKDTYKELGAIVTDNLDETYEMDKPSYINHYTLDGKFTGRVSEVDTTKLGKYLLVYMATDANGNVSNNQLPQSKKWVIVQDTIKPTLKVKDESIGFDPYYSSISFKLEDSNKVDYVEVNGNKFDVSNAKYSDANYQNIKHYLVEGLNKVVLYDTAGNTTEKEFYMDWTVGTTKSADFYVNGATTYNGVQYATNGKTVVANIATSEELGQNPTFTFYNNNNAYPADEVLARGYDEANDKYYYQATLTINKEQKLTDTELTFIATNIVDRGGNKIADVNGPSNGRKVYIDRTKPQFKVKTTSVENGNGYKKLDLQAIDNNMSHVIINGNKYDRTNKYVDINHGHMQKYLVGENTITAVDKAGNETTKTFIIDYNTYVNNETELREALTRGGKVSLGTNLELTDTSFKIGSGVNLTIDTNGKTITGVSSKADTARLFDVKPGATLTLTGNGTITFRAYKPDTNWDPEGFPTYATNTIANSGTLIIDGPTIINTTPKGGASYAVDNYAGGNFTMESGKLQAIGDHAIRMNTATAGEQYSNNVTINNGTITGRRAIWIQLAGSPSTTAPYVNLVINGGIFESTYENENTISSYSYGNSFANTKVTINGGTFNKKVTFGGGYKADTETVTINGGTFNGGIGRLDSTDTWVSIQ